MKILIQNGADPHEIVKFSTYGTHAEDRIDMSFVEFLIQEIQETNGPYRKRAKEILRIIRGDESKFLAIANLMNEKKLGNVFQYLPVEMLNITKKLYFNEENEDNYDDDDDEDI